MVRPRKYKLLVVGGHGVGKSSLIAQFIFYRFLDDYDPYFYDSYEKRHVIDDEVVRLCVPDTSYQEDYRSAEGFLLMYSTTSRKSFEEVGSFYQRVLRFKGQDSFPVVLVGNKCDWKYDRQVSTDEGRTLAKQLGCKFIETSAKQRTNVDEAFDILIREIRKLDETEEDKNTLDEEDSPSTAKHWCGRLARTLSKRLKTRGK